jgi:hypothetical protein
MPSQVPQLLPAQVVFRLDDSGHGVDRQPIMRHARLHVMKRCTRMLSFARMRRRGHRRRLAAPQGLG